MNIQLDISPYKRRLILESTLVLVQEFGFHGTPMSQIAKKAGVAAGTIYHYFESKDQLIQELYAYVKDRLADAVLKDDKPHYPYKERFINFWTQQCIFFIQNEAFLYFLEQYVNSPYARNSCQDESRLLKNKLKQFIGFGINTGEIRDMTYELLVPIIQGSVIAAAKFHLAGDYSFSRHRLTMMASVIWDGIRAQ